MTTTTKYKLYHLQDLNHNSAGWTDWNIVLDMNGGPNWVKNYVDAPIIVNDTGHEYYKQPYFYALGHFSKFIVPDSVHIHHDTQTNVQNFHLTIFERPDGGKVVTVLNTNNQPFDLQVHDPQHGYLDSQVKANSLETFIWY